ncbi:17703_t:CDS:2, partial [Gigaspora rosea]
MPALINESFTFEHLLYQADSEYVSGENVRVEIQIKGTNTWHNVVSGINGSLKLCTREEQNVSHIRFTIQDKYPKSSSSIVPFTPNAFNMMMSAASKKGLPDPRPTTNRNDCLYNNFLTLLRSNNLGWENGTQNIAGKSFVNKLTSLLYYLDNKHQTLKLHSLKIPTFFLQLPLLQNTYYKNGSHYKTTLKHKELEFYADKLEECILEPWASKLCWDQVVTASLELCSVAHTYANYLETVNQHMQKIQLVSAPALSPESNSNLEIRSSYTENAVKEIYLPIAEHIRNASDYEIISLEEYLPDTKEKRFFYLSNLIINSTIMLYRYHHRNYLDNSYSAEVDQRVRMILELGDPEICIDMCKNNGFKGTKFDKFWNEIDSYFNENLLSVHERHHSDILYLPSFISVRDLRESIVEQLENKHNEYPLSNNCLVPSDRWISYQFCPKNNWYKASTQYTERFQVKYMVQTRQLRKSHVDFHYCQAIFKYIQHFVSKYRQFTCLIFADDKHKVPIGEEVLAAFEKDIDAFFKIMTQIDPGLDKSMTTMNQLLKRNLYQDFVKSHCHIRNYMFQKVCMPYNDFQNLSFIPDPEPLENDKDHYKEFEMIYGKPTSERFRPSAMNVNIVNETSEKNQANLLIQELDEIKLQATLDGLYYSCGSQLLPEDHELSERLSMRINLTCDSPIESTYFS